MTKRDLAYKLSKTFSDIEERDLEYIVELFFKVLKESLKRGQKIELRGFGRFELTKAKPYFFTNPKNNQRYYLKEKIRVLFKLGKAFKERLNIPFMAGLDLGTQTFRLILGKYFLGELHFLKSFRENVRLGEGLEESGVISLQAKERALVVLKSFREILNKYQVEDYYAIGTAIFRKAQNAEEFLEEIRHTTGFQVQILTPEEEATLTKEGVLLGLTKLGLDLKNFLVVDVGGGSTELIYFKEGVVNLTKSLNLGALILKDTFNLRYPLTTRTLHSIRHYVEDQLQSLPKDTFEKIVITGGTASLMGSLDLKLTSYEPEKLHGLNITIDRLEKLIAKLSDYPLYRIKKIKGMEEGREDIALPGLIIYAEILKHFGGKDLLISTYGILEATLLYLLKRYN